MNTIEHAYSISMPRVHSHHAIDREIYHFHLNRLLLESICIRALSAIREYRSGTQEPPETTFSNSIRGDPPSLRTRPIAPSSPVDRNIESSLSEDSCEQY